MPLTEDRNTVERAGRQLTLEVAAAVKIFTGALVSVNEDGFAVPGTVAAGHKIAGRAEEYIDNTLGANGDQSINIKRGTFKFDNDTTIPVQQKDVLGPCYIKDDATVRGENPAPEAVNIIAGKVLGIEEDGVWVEI